MIVVRPDLGVNGFGQLPRVRRGRHFLQRLK